MPKRRFERGFEFWVMSAANTLERAANEIFSQHGLTFRQVQILGTLSLYDDLTQAQLADAILVERSTVVRILDRMERDGWIERVPSPTDRRANIIRETPKADSVWKTIGACGKEIRTRASQGLTAEELEVMSKHLSTICDNLCAPPV